MASLRIRNWEKFQHYKFRNPPWIKLYREILDDKQWHELSGDTAKGLIMLWLIASENEGYLPDSTTLAFRLRISENRAIALLSDCSHWIDGLASGVLAERYQDAMPETEKSRDRVREEKTFCASENDARELGSSEFLAFWKEYPRHEGRKKALRVWVKKTLDSELPAVLVGLNAWKAAREPAYMPYAEGWLNQESWKEIPLSGGNDGARKPSKTGERRESAQRISEVVFGRTSGLVESLHAELQRRTDSRTGDSLPRITPKLPSGDTP